MKKVSAIIPIFGSDPNFRELIQALKNQTVPPCEIFVVDSNPDPAFTVPFQDSQTAVIHLRKPDEGAAADYNFAARRAKGEYLLMLQQDCLPELPDMIEKMLGQFDVGTTAVVPTIHYTMDSPANFWGKVSMIKWRGDRQQGICDKFDLIRKDVFKQIGGFDSKTFRYGGEDIDFYMRLREAGQVEGQVVVSEQRVIHKHQQNTTVTPDTITRKLYLLGESTGAQIRRWGLGLLKVPHARNWTQHIAKLGYALLPFCFWKPSLFLVLFFIAQAANWESFSIPGREKILLPFWNCVWFVYGFLGTVKGFLTGRQRYSTQDSSEICFWEVVGFWLIFFPLFMCAGMYGMYWLLGDLQ